MANVIAPETRETLGRLESVLAISDIPPKERQSCARLVDRLRRPVRVGLFGRRDNGNDRLLEALIGPGLLPPVANWPTMEIVHAPEPEVTATLADATSLTSKGLADAALMAQEPVFLRLGLPADILTRMSFLYLSAEDGPGEQLSALSWASDRTEIAIWCTDAFTDAEARIWQAVPDTLKYHALLVAAGTIEGAKEVLEQEGLDFQGVFAIPELGIDPTASEALDGLLSRLDADIDEARRADVDFAQLILHRLGQLAPEMTADAKTATEVVAPEPAEQGPAEPGNVVPARTLSARRSSRPHAIDPQAREQVLSALSEPFLYLKRRARGLAEVIDWREGEDEDWAGQVLDHCIETTEGLRDRSADWPDDRRSVATLRQSLEEACDTAILLQIEGGMDQARDAAALLMQLRGDFERELAA